PRTSKISQIVEPELDPTDIAVGYGSVWVFDDQAGIVARIEPLFGSVTRTITVRPPGADTGSDSAYGQPTAIAVGEGADWVADGLRGIGRIDRRTEATSTISLGRRIDGVATGAGAVWAVSGQTASVLRIDPRTHAVTTIPIVTKPGVLSPYPYMVAVGEGFVWVVNGNTATVTKVDPEQRGVAATFPLSHQANSIGLTVGAG